MTTLVEWTNEDFKKYQDWSSGEEDDDEFQKVFGQIDLEREAEKEAAALTIQSLTRCWLAKRMLKAAKEKALAEERSRIQADKDIFPSESEAKASWEKQMAGLRDRQRRGEYRIGDSRLTDGPCPWWN